MHVIDVSRSELNADFISVSTLIVNDAHKKCFCVFQREIRILLEGHNSVLK